MRQQKLRSKHFCLILIQVLVALLIQKVGEQTRGGKVNIHGLCSVVTENAA